MSGGSYFRASARRARQLPPAWVAFPYPGHRTMADVMASEGPVTVTSIWPAPSSAMAGLGGTFPDWPDAPLPDETEAFALPAGDARAADSEGGCAALAPEGTSGAPAGDGYHPANASAPHNDFASRAKAGVETAGTEHARPCPVVEPVSRPAAGRSAAATSEKMDVTAGETAPDPDDDDGAIVDEFRSRLAAVQSRRAASQPAPVNWGRVADARSAGRPSARPASPKAPTNPAPSREECQRCGIPGFRGCAHWLPYDAVTA